MTEAQVNYAISNAEQATQRAADADEVRRAAQLPPRNAPWTARARERQLHQLAARSARSTRCTRHSAFGQTNTQPTVHTHSVLRML